MPTRDFYAIIFALHSLKKYYIGMITNHKKEVNMGQVLLLIICIAVVYVLHRLIKHYNIAVMPCG